MTGRLIVTYISGYLYNLGNVYISRLTQTWGQLLSNVIDYITITLQFS